MNLKNEEQKLDNLEAELSQFLKREEQKLERTHKSYSQDLPKKKRKKFFKDTRVGRFLSGRTSAGRGVRRVGLAALGLGGLNVAGLGPEINQLTADANGIVDQFNELILLLGAMLTTLSHIIDKLEHYDTVSEEREQAEGQIPALKKVIRSISQQKNELRKERLQ